MRGMAMMVALAAVSVYGDLFVFSRDGARVECGPRELPAADVRLDTRQPVLGLVSADDAVRRACGWYRVVPAAETGTNVAVTGRGWVIRGGVAQEWVTVTNRPARQGNGKGLKARIAAIRVSGSNVTERCVDALAEELARRAGQ